MLACLSAVLCLALTWHAAAEACKSGGTCSIGHSRFYTGDIRSGTSLRQFIAAVAYKRELILVPHASHATGAGEDEALQLWQELRHLGYAHVAFVTPGVASCLALQLLERAVSCVWDSSPLCNGTETSCGGVTTILWHMRLRTHSRAVRLGVNVLQLDGDMMVMDEFYQHLKQPMFQRGQMLCKREGPPASCNLGWVYVQNAAPDGPVSWGFHYTSELLLRQLDDPQYMIAWSKSSMPTQDTACFSFDQALQGAAFVSTFIGRLHLAMMYEACTLGLRDGTPEYAARQAALRAFDHELAWPHRTVGSVQDALPTPGFPKIPKCIQDSMTWLDTNNITLPNLAIPWSPELGGKLLPEPGFATLKYRAQLKEDCPACPWWDEQRPLPFTRLPAIDTSKPMPLKLYNDAAGAKHTEVMLQPPEWVVASMHQHRHGQVVGPAWPIQMPLPLFNHVHVVELVERGKMQLRKLFGRYNYTLATAAKQFPYTVQQNVTRVLALSPQLDLGYTRNLTEIAAILTGLVQMALLTGRTPVMPTLPCHTPWLHATETRNPALGAPSEPCVYPVYTGSSHELPLHPLPLRTDHRGELLGGWAGFYDGPLPAAQRHLAAAAVAAEKAGSTSAAAPAGGPSAAGQAAAAEVPGGLPGEQIRMAIPLHWDVACARTGVGAMIMPELFHWLGSSASGGARLEPTRKNTALALHPAAEQLRPWPVRQQPPGSKAPLFATSQTGVLQAQSTHGWSLADVQVGLHVGVAARELARFSDEPLLYLAHPVALLPPRRPKSKWAAKYQHIRTTMASSSCKAFQVQRPGADQYEWHTATVANMSRPLVGTIASAGGGGLLMGPQGQGQKPHSLAAPQLRRLCL